MSKTAARSTGSHRSSLSHTTVQAPISGVIASRSIKTGNFVQINTPIFRIVDDSQLEATLNVPERELATLKSGQPVTLLADALPGQQFIGKVDRIAPVVDSGSGTFRVVCAFGQGAEALQPGMFGRIRIDYDQRKDALVIPRLALLDDGEPAVFVVRNGKASRVPVKLGYAEGPWLEVRQGLKEGDGGHRRQGGAARWHGGADHRPARAQAGGCGGTGSRRQDRQR